MGRKIPITGFLLLVWLAAAGPLRAQLAEDAPWPMFRQNLRHTGWTNKNVLGSQKPPVVLWSFLAGGTVYSSPAIAPDGTVFFGSRDDRVYAVTNGGLKWSYAANNDFDSSPALDRSGVVYIGCYNNILYALTNGNVKWTYNAGSAILGSPVISSNKTVYFGTWSGVVRAVTNGVLKWSYTTGGQIWGTPAVGKNEVIHICSDDGSIYALTNGAVKWSYATGSALRSSPAIGPDGTVYFGTVNNQVYAVTNGALRWVFNTAGRVDSSPALGSGGTVIVGSDGGRVYAITNGAQKWLYSAGSDYSSSPALGADGTVYIGNWNGRVYAITNGVLRWSYLLPSAVESSPAIGRDGTIYAGCYDSRLYALRYNARPELVWSGNPGYTADGVKPGTNMGGTYFRFEIKYKDADNDRHARVESWIDMNDNGLYEPEEKFSLYSNSGSSWTNGIVFTNSVLLYASPDGFINYRFFCEDRYGLSCMTNYAVSNHLVRVTNRGYNPRLSWIGEPNFITDGVHPDTVSGGTNFVFRIRYTNTNNQAPSVKEVWIDRNDDSTYDLTERFTMLDADPADADYRDGKDYAYTNLIGYAGDGVFNYRYFFSDGISLAAGSPVSNRTFTIMKTNVYYVKTNGNDSYPGNSIEFAWKTIQKAARTLRPADAVLILPGAYAENVTNRISGTSLSNIRFAAYSNGVEVYRVQGSPQDAWTISGVNYIRVSGLKVTNNSTDGTGAGRGFYISSTGSVLSNMDICRFRYGLVVNGSSLRIKKCKIRNNHFGIQEYVSLSLSLFQSNSIVYNGVTGITNYGGSCWDCILNNVYDGNDISRNGGRGIYFDYHGPRNKYLNNKIHSNGNWGIWPRDAGNPGIGGDTMVSNNSFIANAGGGIGLGNFDGPTFHIIRNYFYNNGSTAIGVGAGGSYLTDVKFNRIEQHTTYGILTSGLRNDSIIQSNIIKRCAYGIYTSGSWVNIRSNAIYSNSTAGIYLGTAGNKIVTNRIFRNTLGINANTSKNYIARNSVFSNYTRGIQTGSSSQSNFIYTNSFYGRVQSHGISVSGKGQMIGANLIYGHATNGIFLLFSTNSRISHNLIFSNRTGVLNKNSFSSIFLNSISNNIWGIVSESSPVQDCSRNNLFPNSRYGLSNTPAGNGRWTNNWWGSTIASNIRKRIFGVSHNSNFTPYRLYGPVDIAPFADADAPDRVSGLISLVSEATVKLSWNKCSSGDFARYSVYRSRFAGTTNLTRAQVITNIYDAGMTNLDNFPGNGRWVYTVTALDNKPVFTNESWYSLQTNAVVSLITVISLMKSISNVLLNNMPVVSIPGSTITYKIVYSNLGGYEGSEAVIYDRIGPYVTFSTDGGGTAPGWTFEHSTNPAPDQGYFSGDYYPGYSSDKGKIQWIRWRKEVLPASEDGLFLIYKTIIR